MPDETSPSPAGLPGLEALHASLVEHATSAGRVISASSRSADGTVLTVEFRSTGSPDTDLRCAFETRADPVTRRTHGG